MKQLSLWTRVIFVDWHGVLSLDPFWISILNNRRHPLRSQLQQRVGELFATGATVDQWMKGQLTSEGVISSLGISPIDGFSEDYLARTLIDDCARMRVNVELFEILRSAQRSGVFVVLATDNVDTFARKFHEIHSKLKRGATKSRTFASWGGVCDDILCSSTSGTLKSENPMEFFGPWLSDAGISFSDALLIDDRADNCNAFRAQGGHSIQWKMGASPIQDVHEATARWLASATTPVSMDLATLNEPSPSEQHEVSRTAFLSDLHAARG